MHKAASKNELKKNELKKQGFAFFLQGELVKRCKKNPRYSLRAFAKTLDIDPSLLSKILRGKKSIGRKLIRDFGFKLGLSPQAVEKFATPHQFSNDYVPLSMDVFHLISDWCHYAILQLMDVEGFRPDPQWIARQLGISHAEAQEALVRLERLKLAEKTASGAYLPTREKLTTTGFDFTSQAQRKHQEQLLHRAIAALEQVPYEQRDQSSIIMAIDPEQLPYARERIKEFRRALDAELEARSRSKKSVYAISVSFFPLSLPVQENKKRREQ